MILKPNDFIWRVEPTFIKSGIITAIIEDIPNVKDNDLLYCITFYDGMNIKISTKTVDKKISEDDVWFNDLKKACTWFYLAANKLMEKQNVSINKKI